MTAHPASRSHAPLAVAATAAVALATALAPMASANAGWGTAAPLAKGVATPDPSLASAESRASTLPRAAVQSPNALPAGVPTSGTYSFLLKLGAKPTDSAF